MFSPGSTYRIQFHKGFTLKDLKALIPYFELLKIKTIYASPVYSAVSGSMHGYDGIHFGHINPEIGTTEELSEMCRLLREKGIYWLQDIVPNHMAYHEANEWLMDVLEKGEASAYASYFDLWKKDGRIMAPFLGSSLGEAIEKEELKLMCEGQRIVFSYFDRHFPLHASSGETVRQLQEHPEAAIELANGDKAMLHALCDEQFYELCHWSETDRRINYRRFFTVNSLICLNVQDDAVFSDIHRHVLSLLQNGTIQGLRVDHIDGLYAPAAYLNTLREGVGKEAFICVEKILEPGEELPKQWPVQGSTGYDFLALVNNLFTNKGNEKILTGFYEQLLKKTLNVDEAILDKKRWILERHMQGELQNTVDLYCEISDSEKVSPEKRERLKQVIAEFLVHCPVYRYYGNEWPLPEDELFNLTEIVATIKTNFPELVDAAEDFANTLLNVHEKKHAVKEQQRALHFYRRCMQLTGPLMAKGVEDTLMYSCNRFIAHNEVGDSPAAFGISHHDFHEAMQKRLETWPLSLNATSTHDTKRGEDVRARLNVISDMPDDWMRHVTQWQRMNANLKERDMPDANDEYFIYQTIAGAYPMPGKSGDDFSRRLTEYMIKALREAKEHSNWSQPNESYEKATTGFIKKLLQEDSAFFKSFLPFHQTLALHGVVNSLSQLVLKHSCPGTPDTYQGTELWDLSLVDPDNRRPVNYGKAKDYAERFSADTKPAIEHFKKNPFDAEIKWLLTQTLLKERKNQSDLFEKGLYIPLDVKGKHKDHVFSFARRYEKNWLIVIVPMHTAAMNQKGIPQAASWKDTHVLLPGEAPENWKHILTEKELKSEAKLYLKEAATELPFIVLRSEEKKCARRAGVLLAISSLPSAFGVGDLGPSARQMIRFLSAARQSYWQLLPLNPTSAETGHSPYSSASAMAGNPLWISPELLAGQGLLKKDELENAFIEPSNRAMYAEAKEKKDRLFRKAYTTFFEPAHQQLQHDFIAFCKKEKDWLDDYTAYCVLKGLFQNKPWFEWPEEYKDRFPDALAKLREEHAEKIKYIAWEQYIFHTQWEELRAFAKTQGVKLFGDLPFYLSHDSADVWSNRGIFSLNEDGALSGIAGVPPDYFSDTGQLWGMPTYRWDVLKEDAYAWWISRMRKNLQLFDLLRIDHFRALESYWEVPAGSENAVRGAWMKGPGKDFFDVMKQELGDLPFVAEDLGYEMEAVYVLREETGLPGMKVLQFAFGENLPEAVDIPHHFTTNCIVYTGTHDNNTTAGWYEMETSKEDRQRLERYTGCKVSAKNVCEVMIRLAYASVAQTAIIPAQDLLGLGRDTRMNLPGNSEENWLWRLMPGQLGADCERSLYELCRFYNRH
jgi:malto-oligosyltrehalose synthase/4-alpha-glucanotransferase